MSDVKKTDLEKTARDAQEQTDRFTDHDAAGERKTARTSDDIASGMPEKTAETLEKTSKTG